jgi:outer membrane protein OmpA-like peptidoglycan-associated protein
MGDLLAAQGVELSIAQPAGGDEVKPMYIYDRQSSALQNRYEERSLVLRPSQRVSIYVPTGSYVGELHQSPRSVSQPITLTMRARPFLVLEGFGFNKYLLSRRHKEKLKILAGHIVKSWRTSQPIRTIRLIGHTDEIGSDDYNVKLGKRRAEAVKAALQEEIATLSPGLAKGPTKRINIDTDTRGKKAPVTRERTKRALNRRVEVFLSAVGTTPPPPQPTAPKQPQIDLRKLPPETIRRLEDEGRKEAERKRLTRPTPIGPQPRGKSISAWLDERLEKTRLPKWFRHRIRNAVLSGACYALQILLGQAVGQLSDTEKKEFRQKCLEVAKRRAR